MPYDDEHPRAAYRTLRRVVGVLGVLLPVVLAVGNLFFESPARLLDSISAYYGTMMRDVLVGVLFAVGWFLFAYHPYGREDDVAGYLGCAFALGVALFPTTSPHPAVRIVHGASAFALFLVLAYFSLVLFRRSDKKKLPDPKRKRNIVYTTCGITILACIALIAVDKLLLAGTFVDAANPVFWLESLALWAFGLSWFVKGETLWRDPQGR